MAIFLRTWLGQVVSLIGSGVADFALSVAVYQARGSISEFGAISFALTVPSVLLAPFAGVLVDRWDRRRLLMLADGGGFAMRLLLLAVLSQSSPAEVAAHPAALYPPLLLGACFTALRWPALMAATPMLVPPAQLGRANGLLELAGAIWEVASPAVAGVLLAALGLFGLLGLDALTSLLAVVTLATVRFPPVRRSAEGSAVRGVFGDIAYGWRFIKSRRGLLQLMLYSASINLLTSLVVLLFTPLCLSFTDAAHLGLILTVAGVGAVSGALLTSIWGGPRRRILPVLLCPVASGAVLLLGLLPLSVGLVATLAFLYLLPGALQAGSVQSIWQVKVPQDLHGRVLAVRRLLNLGMPAVAALLVGPLAEGVFKPLLAPGGALVGPLGGLLGVGEERGLCLLVALLGLCTIAVSLLAGRLPALRGVEADLPDA